MTSFQPKEAPCRSSHTTAITSYDTAVDILYQAAAELRPPNEQDGNNTWEDVSLLDAVGRVAAADVLSLAATPEFDTSVMDGYAVRSESTALASPETPLLLGVRGTIAAGDEPTVLGENLFQGDAAESCLEITTGGIFPVVSGSKRQFDACVRVEYTALASAGGGNDDAEQFIMITKPVRRDAIRRPAGCGIRAGQRVVGKGDVVGASHVMPLASAGASGVRVLSKPRVAVWSTGEKLVAGSVPDVNGPFLVAALREAGAEPSFLRTLTDREDAVRKSLRETIDGGRFDVVLTTGGVSVGKFDFLASSLGGLGARTRFHGVAMRPGHPVLFAEVPGPSQILPVFGLSGNPGAAAACFRFLVVPFLRSWSHQAAETPVMARCLDDLVTNGYGGGGRKAASPGIIPPTTSFRHGTLKQLPDGDMAVELSKQQSPAKLGPFIDADCWVRTGGHSRERGPRRPLSAAIP
ncbi:Putative molybdopterin biosynthesis protein MoeA [Colletotrichum destructivum]|uniref:molybdopterin adenylyltransferase n=1 Tax=Colletotrichum destructivum TaxID=34406 RepID=A0AAX4IXC3_9PEZI|nr:Putative molybdopterin biosynthesis protein MoeA [Colletotrichum destructivum]